MGTNGPISASIPPTEIYMAGALAGKTIKVLKTTINQETVCAIASDDKAYCWGSNQQGQLGANLNPISYPWRLEPTAVDTSGVLAGKIIKNIELSQSGTTCATSSENNAYCWGTNNYGQVGDGTRTRRISPVLISLP